MVFSGSGPLTDKGFPDVYGVNMSSVLASCLFIPSTSPHLGLWTMSGNKSSMPVLHVVHLVTPHARGN